MRVRLAFPCLFAAACGGSSGAPPIGDDDEVMPDGSQVDLDADTPVIDNDGDGLDDAYELALANDYLPFISLAPDDGCTRDGLVVRVRPHPQDPTKISIFYDHLFESDCGLNGHTGDDEMFGIAIDPQVPPPLGILAIKTASHQNTPCERVTECTTCGVGNACDMAAMAGATYPVIYASKDKHGQYATKGSCGFGTCFDSCTLNAAPAHPAIVNAGEPGHPLATNLTTEGFITAGNGWTKAELMNVDPWAPGDFGGAGAIADDLIDDTFVATLCN